MTASPDTPPDDPLLTVAEVAARFRVNRATVHRWIAAGYLTDIRTGPKLRRCLTSEVDALALGHPPSVSGIPSQRSTR